jgi:predicted metal-dependent hydrolase
VRSLKESGPRRGKRGYWSSLLFRSQCFIEKIERILERYKTYLGVRDVAVEIRPYKTRTAFTKLSSPPIIHLNEYLIDDKVR